MPLRILPLAAAAALALVPLGAASPATAGSGSHHVVVTATKSHHLHLQTQIPAGVVRFEVRGPAMENLQLAQARTTAGPKELAADGNELNRKGLGTGIERDFLAVGGVSAGHSLWVRLAPGTYYALDTNAQKATADEVMTLTVTGDGDQGSLPQAGATITAVHEMSWAKQPASIPASGKLRFVNASTDYHFVELARLKSSSTTLADVKKALKTNNESIVDESSIYDTGVLSPGLTQDSGYRLKRGTYAVLCFWPDEHGVPHALMGMVRLIHVV